MLTSKKILKRKPIYGGEGKRALFGLEKKTLEGEEKILCHRPDRAGGGRLTMDKAYSGRGDGGQKGPGSPANGNTILGLEGKTVYARGSWPEEAEIERRSKNQCWGERVTPIRTREGRHAAGI